MKTLGNSLLLFGVLFLFTVSIAHAQNSLNTVIRVSPENVRADQPFSVSLSSSDIDLDRATISWTVNEKPALSGIGKRGFSSVTGPVGTEFRVRATIEPLSGRTITRSIVVRPQEIDFLWRSFSYTPPFYEGRSLAPSAGFVSVTAMPNMVDGNGNLLDPEELVYTWTQDGVILGSASGFGKQSIVLENAQVPERLLQLQVTVSSLNKAVETKGRVVVPLSEPRILFYERQPLLGVNYARILRSISLESDDVVVRAEPYFFSRDDVDRDRLLYKWELNNVPLDDISEEKKNEITLGREERTGRATLSLQILNDNLPFRILQKALRELTIDIE